MPDIQPTIIHYLDGTATRDEKRMLLTWLDESAANQQEFMQVRDLWLGSNVSLGTDDETETAFVALRHRIVQSLAQKTNTLKRKKILFATLRIASVFLLTFALNYILFHAFDNPGEDIYILNRLITSENTKGRFVLPDSTVVWLNKNSMLEYPETFSSCLREVRLTGEAYFDVVKNVDSKFQVSTGDVCVEVAGTSFVVQNYAGRRATEIVLVSGSVSVDTGKSGIMALSPGQLLSLDKTSDKVSIDSVDTGNYIGWLNNKLIFDNQQLSDVIIQMQEWYGIDIVCPSRFAAKNRVTFTIRDESIEEILKAIQLIVQMNYRWEKQTLYIEPKR